jgi:DNA polymerase III epsilon subunit-like protein
VTAWWEGPLAGFDLETTSTEPEEARVVTAALAVCRPHATVDARTWLANPGVPIPDEAAEVHGVTTERAQAEGRDRAEVVGEVVTRLAVAVQAGWPLVVFNARYDLTVLDREARRLDVLPLVDRSGVAGELRVVDPLVVDKHLDRYRKGSRKLDAICGAYGARLDGAHDAAFDAVAAARVAWALGARGRVIRRAWNAAMERERAELIAEWDAVRFDLGALHAAQVRWARLQAEGLAQHFREAGKPGADDVRTEWPWVPAAVAA